MAVVELDRLTKLYEGTSEPAVKDVSLRIDHGEFMVLLGPSGCGKSTTLRMIAGLESITSGTLTIDGRSVNDIPAKDRDIAMVFQSYALYPHMTARDNLAFGLRRRNVGREEIDRRVTSVAATLGLTEYLARKPYALSGGQRQRVALGRAIVRDPKVFLFDEPLSNLDAALRVSTRSELIKLHRRLGTTMIYVTHDQVEAMTMGTRICIMNKSRVVQIGKPLEVYANPVNMFVAAFLGSPPMNLFRSRVLESAGSALALSVGQQRVSIPRSYPLQPGDTVVFGVRPEDIYEPPDTPPGGSAMELASEVVAVEPLGAETLLLLRVPGHDQDLIARVGRRSVARIGDRPTLRLDPAAVHLFDVTTTDAILPTLSPHRSGALHG